MMEYEFMTFTSILLTLLFITFPIVLDQNNNYHDTKLFEDSFPFDKIKI